MTDAWAGRRDVFAACFLFSKCSEVFTLHHLLSIINTLLNLTLVGSLKLASRSVTHGRRGYVDVLLLITHIKEKSFLPVPGGKYQVFIAQLYHFVCQSFMWTCLCWSATTTKQLTCILRNS